MQKVNRMMMKTVAVLLILVLITTSILSGTLAKYVSAKSAAANVALKNFGVNVSFSFSSEIKNLYGEDILNDSTKTTKSGDSVIVTLSNLKMAPGDSFLDAIHVNISGTAGTRIKVLIEPGFYYNQAIAAAEKGVPIELYMKCLDESNKNASTTLIRQWNSMDYSYQGKAMQRNVAVLLEQRLGGTAQSRYIDQMPRYGYIEKIFESETQVEFYSQNDTNKQVPINDLYFGFAWPETSDANDTWFIENHSNASLSMFVKITVEQVTDDYVIPVET